MPRARKPVRREQDEPATRTFVLPTADEELNAISVVMDVLDDLDIDQSERVLRYVQSRKALRYSCEIVNGTTD